MSLSNAANLTYLPAGAFGFIASMAGLITFVKDGSAIGLLVCLAVPPILYPIFRTVFGKVCGLGVGQTSPGGGRAGPTGEGIRRLRRSASRTIGC